MTAGEQLMVVPSWWECGHLFNLPHNCGLAAVGMAVDVDENNAASNLREPVATADPPIVREAARVGVARSNSTGGGGCRYCICNVGGRIKREASRSHLRFG